VEPLNILGMVHYETLTRANDILEDPEDPSLSHLAILEYVYNHILQGDPSMEIRNKYTDEVTLASVKQNLPLQKHPLQVTVYPNPSSGIFTLGIKGDTSGVDYVKVYDLAGRLIRKIAIPEQETPMTTSVTTPPEMEMQIDLSTLSEGLYILGLGDEVMKRAVICK